MVAYVGNAKRRHFFDRYGLFRLQDLKTRAGGRLRDDETKEAWQRHRPATRLPTPDLAGAARAFGSA